MVEYRKRIKNPGKKKLDLAEKVHGNKPEYKGLKGFELWKKLKQLKKSMYCLYYFTTNC